MRCRCSFSRRSIWPWALSARSTGEAGSGRARPGRRGIGDARARSCRGSCSMPPSRRTSRRCSWTSSRPRSSSSSRTCRCSRKRAGLRCSSRRARRGRDHLALKGQRIALDQEASGISAVVRERTALAVYDAERSTVVNRRLNEIARAKSCVFVPVRAGEAVIGVVFGAVRQSRVFGEDELTRMQALVSEAGPALERSRATVALADALERERLISRISSSFARAGMSTRCCRSCSGRLVRRSAPPAASSGSARRATGRSRGMECRRGRADRR